MSTDDSERVAALEQTVKRLGSQLSELQEELGRVRGELASVGEGQRLTMRKDHTCPACAHRRILFAARVRGGQGSRERMAMAQPSVWRTRTVGKFRAYVCARCGHVEWYVENPAELEAEEGVCQVLEPPPQEPERPYR